MYNWLIAAVDVNDVKKSKQCIIDAQTAQGALKQFYGLDRYDPKPLDVRQSADGQFWYEHQAENDVESIVTIHAIG